MAKQAKPKRDMYQEVTDAIVQQLEAGTAPWRKPWAVGQHSGRNPLRHNGERYSGINWLLLQMTPHSNPTFMTFKQAQDYGGNVRKGEKGFPVVFFTTFEKSETNAKGEEETKRIPVLKHYTVFNVEQIDGLPDRFYPKPIEINTDERDARADAFVTATGAKIAHGGDRAFYAPALDSVQMPPFAAFESAVGYYGTLLHELVHWTGHETRCARDLKNQFGSKDYAREELVAEIGAAMACAMLDLETTVRADHASYLASWLKVLKADKRAIFRAAAMAQTAVNHLVSLQQAQAVAA